MLRQIHTTILVRRLRRTKFSMGKGFRQGAPANAQANVQPSVRVHRSVADTQLVRGIRSR